MPADRGRSERRTDEAEERRILLAALRAQIHTNVAGRWLIEGQERPYRHVRERLVKRRLLRVVTYPDDVGWFYELTEKGRRRIKEVV